MGIEVSKDRLEARIKELACIGATSEGGITRLPYTREERDAVHLVQQYMDDAGLKTFFDEFGNLYGRLEGSDPEAPAVMSGSHVDTVVNGGAFDGVVGTLSSIEALKVINETRIQHKHPLVAAVFVSEESARFGAGTLGSNAAVGNYSRADLDRLKDMNGTTLAQALRKCGYDPDKLESVVLDPQKIKCFVELHIEQSIILETKKISIGVVDKIAAPTNMRLTIHGRAGHAGATPMNLRTDAFSAAAEIALAVEKIANTIGKETVGTVGEVKVVPNAINVIPGKVILGIDVRDVTAERKDAAVNQLVDAFDEVAGKRKVKIEQELLSCMLPVDTAPEIVNLIRTTCAQLGFSYTNVTSGAYHDALNMAKITDIGMIFVPSVNGISHAKEEFTPIDDIHRGAQVLVNVLVKLAT